MILVCVKTKSEKGLAMKTWQVTALSLALALPIAVRSPADNPSKVADVNETRAMADAAAGNNWMLNGRTFDEQHFSPLKEITDKNISGLGLAWFLDIDSGMGIVSEPI